MDKRVKGLELEQDLAFQRREWAVQRIGWWALAGFVLAALLGVFGNGPLSSARAGDPDAPFSVEYERFVRVGARTRLIVHIGQASPGEQVREVRINREYFESIRVERIEPEPERVQIGAQDVRLLFEVPADGTASTVVFDVEPVLVGPRSASITLQPTSRLAFRQFAYF